MGRGRGSGTTELFSWDWVARPEAGGMLGALTTPLSPYPPARHLPPAVSGVPTALRVPASGAMGPAPQRMTVASTSERSSGLGTARRPCVGRPTASSAQGRASACGRGSSRGLVSAEACSPRGEFGGLDSCCKDARGSGAWLEGGGGEGAGGPDLLLIRVPPTPGETRRILSVQPTYDWTCFSHSLLNVSPMPVESSPPLPCPTPCHLLPNCTSCLDSKGADGGWQHCVWSSSLQQVLTAPSGVCCGPPPCCTLTFLQPRRRCPTSASISLGLVPPSHFLFLPTFSSLAPSNISFFPLCLVLVVGFFLVFFFWLRRTAWGILVP